MIFALTASAIALALTSGFGWTVWNKKTVAFNEAAVCGFTSTKYFPQLGVWLAYCSIWVPLRAMGLNAWDRATKESPKGFIARNMFRGDTFHCFCQAGAGFGKSSLLKEAIADQMQGCLDGKRSLFLMDDSHLIDEVLATVDPTEDQIRKRFILVDVAQAGGPGDIGCLPRLNMLNTGAGAGNSYTKTTAKAAIFEMVFGSLLEGNETTGPMAAMLSFAAKTLSYCDDPTPDDFIRLLRDPHAFMEEIPNVPRMVREFWEDKVRRRPIKVNGEFSRYEVVPNQTAEALATRAYQMISNDIVRRLLCNPVETVNLAERLNEGAIVLVATRSGVVTSTGARHIGRFMLAMLLRAAMGRDENDALTPTAGHIDEFPLYLAGGFDESIDGLLARARKKRIALNLYNQNEGQLHPKMVKSLISNCGTLIAGGTSPQFAQMLSHQMGIKKIDSGPDKGNLNVDPPGLPRRQFAASWNGRDPIIIKSKKDALGDAFTPLPANAKARKKKIRQVMARTHRIMREMYAEDPVQQAIDEADNVVEIKEAMPI